MSSPFRQLAEIPPPRQPISGRLPKNPIDKCTIVSIFPKHIVEVKHTIEPGRFEILPGTYDNPSLLEVGSSSWWMNRGDDQPTLEVPVFSINIAHSIINDYCNGLLACDMVDRVPGLFFVEGKADLKKIREEYQPNLDAANAKQKNWYVALVKIADSLWARSGGNPLAIPDESRIAARELKQDDKPWLSDFQMSEVKACFACGSPKNPSFPVCPTCRAIDPSHAAAKEIKFAGQ
jgi:hypothetical protein